MQDVLCIQTTDTSPRARLSSSNSLQCLYLFPHTLSQPAGPSACLHAVSPLLEFPSFLPCYFPTRILCANQNDQTSAGEINMQGEGDSYRCAFTPGLLLSPPTRAPFPKPMDLTKGSQPTMTRYHFTHTRVASTERLTISSLGENVGKLELSYRAAGM